MRLHWKDVRGIKDGGVMGATPADGKLSLSLNQCFSHLPVLQTLSGSWSNADPNSSSLEESARIRTSSKLMPI